MKKLAIGYRLLRIAFFLYMHNFIFIIFALFLTQGNGSDSAQYRYVFENNRFLITMQEIEFNSSGQGKYWYKRKDSDEKVAIDLVLSPTTLSQIKTAFDELNFLDSTENYQYKKDFSHLGNMTLSLSRGGKERSIRYNYTENKILSRLTDIFRNITTQESRVLEIENVRATDSLSMPAQMRQLQSELQSNRIADPARLVPVLNDLKNDDSIPLIARNHAERLLKLIAEKN